MNKLAQKEFCALMDANEIEYVVVEEFLNKVEVLIHPSCAKRIEKVLKNSKYKKLVHPYGAIKGFKLLYQMHDFLLYKKSDTYFEIEFEMRCMSLMDKTWMPLDKIIQESIWIDKKTNEDGIFLVDASNYLIYIITRSIFLKEKFTENDIRNIEQNLMQIESEKTLLEKLEAVFFGFSDELYVMIKQKKYNDIVEKYNTYINY